LGRTIDRHTNNFEDECFAAVLELAHTELETESLESAVAALGHIANRGAIPAILAHRQHASPDVRHSVAVALGSFANDPEAIEALLALMKDEDEDVRDWATFGLGVAGDADTPEIRSALLDRLADVHRDVREEAMAGLGKRRDQRILGPLIAALSDPGASDCVCEAAFELLGLEKYPPEWSGEDYIAALTRKFGDNFA
jgi:HEAT repeat protein